MTSKKIVIVAPHMIAGGVEKALLNMLRALIRYGEVEITLLLARRNGIFLDAIPKEVEVAEIVMPADDRERLFRGFILSSVWHYLRRGMIISALRLAWLRLAARDPVPELLGNFRKIPALPGSFDIAIAYHMHMPFLVKYVSDKITARRKIAWMHNDLKKSMMNIGPLVRTLQSFSALYAVSRGLADEMAEVVPKLAGKVSVFHNIIESDDILRKAKEEVDFDAEFEGFRIMTFGRLDRQKGIDIALKSLALLKKRGLFIRWYFLGSGKLEAKLKARAKRLGVAEDAVFMGTRVNPYPYLKKCDLYVQSSRHEGWAIGVQEARILCKPLVVTDVIGLREQVEDGVTGLVAKGTAGELAKVIERVVNEPGLLKSLENNLSQKGIEEEGMAKLAEMLVESEALSA
jgi:glycosyltransferase involved in cell wall biosynthesis